jgi:xanthine dehydrogenase large subunit
VAASRFGVDVSTVKITATDTGKVPNTSATAASSGTDLNGMAVQIACDTIRDRIAACVSEQHVGDVQFENGQVIAGDTTLTFAEAAMLAYTNRVSLSATGFYKTPDLSWNRIKGQGRPFFYFAQGIALTEVVIDTLTGENRILRTDVIHDAGASLNPALDIGQIEGGYVQGAGWLTTEELVWDSKGRLRTHAPATYKIPAMSDRPDVFNVSLWDAPNPAHTVYRSKAVGEPPFMLGISAFLALSDAVAACGDAYPDLHAPATAEQVLASIKRAKA